MAQSTARDDRTEHTAAQDDVDPRRWRVLWVCLVAGFMTLLDVSIVNVALPSVQHGVGASGSQLQWVLTGYAVVFGLALVPAGRLGDSYGRKRVFLVGLVVFLLGSLVCGVATDPLLLVLGRVVQGLGAGTLNPQISAIINAEFRGDERGRAFGLFGASIGLSTAVGPLLGGAIIDFLPVASPWRCIFLVNLPVGAAALVLGLRLLPSRPSAARERLDVVGSLLLGLAVIGILVPVQERGGLGVPVTVVSIVSALACAAAFVAWEHRYDARGHLPLVRPGLLATPGFGPGVLVGALYFAGFTSIFFSLTLYLQDALGYSPLRAGLSQTSFAVAAGITAPLAGRAVARLGRALVVRGLCLVVVGLLGLISVVVWVAPAVGRSWTGLLIGLPLVVMGAGSGQVISPNVNLSLACVERTDAGSASGVFQTFQRLGAGLGLAVVGAVFFHFAAQRAWERALTGSLASTTALIALALVPAGVDAARHRRSGGGDEAGEDAPPSR